MKADVHIISISSLCSVFKRKREKVFSGFLFVGHFDLISNLSMDVNVIVNGFSYSKLLPFGPVPVFLFHHHTDQGIYTHLPIVHANQIIFSSSSCIDGSMYHVPHTHVPYSVAFLIYLSMIDLLVESSDISGVHWPMRHFLFTSFLLFFFFAFCDEWTTFMIVSIESIQSNCHIYLLMMIIILMR